MKTILREHIPYGISLGVYTTPQDAIQKLQDPHATIHKVPDNLIHKGQESNLLKYVKAQKIQGLCFDVFSALSNARKEQEEKADD